MAVAVVSWDQRPEYLAYTDWTPVPGVTSYLGPRGGSGTNVTQFHPGQASLSEHNLPDIMYQLYPCEEWKRFKESPLPGPKLTSDYSPMYEQYTRPGHKRQVLLDFKILPDKISTEEGWWYYEFVRRMDPRIRQRDIIMREEATAERLRMNDQQYINIHLNTPGYRIYRPAWKMIAWHVTIGDNKKKQSVLDGLSDAQKQANTTRGSTPGLIEPALGDIPGNRVDVPALGSRSRKRGPNRATVNINNPPVTQPIKISKALQARQGPPVYHSPYPAQGSRGSRSQQSRQSSRADSDNAITTPSSVESAATGAPSQVTTNNAAASGQHDTVGHINAQARDAAAMPPPPRPRRPQGQWSLQTQGSGSHSKPRCLPSQPAVLDGPGVGVEELESLGARKDYVPETEHLILSYEEMAAMSAQSDEAMAEIYRMCEPFVDPCPNIPGPPPMDLSDELIDDLGIRSLFPIQGEVKASESGSNSTELNPARTAEARNGTPHMQGTKRKGYDEDNRYFEQVQLDVEKQDRRPVKRVKSVHRVNFPSNDGELYQNTGYKFQQSPYIAPQRENYQLGSGNEQAFSGGFLPSAQPLRHALVVDNDPNTGGLSCGEQNGGINGQQSHQIFGCYQAHYYPPTSFGTAFPNYQPSCEPLASPYLPASASSEEVSHGPSSFPNPEFSAGESLHDGIQVGQAPRNPCPEPLYPLVSQSVSHQSAIEQRRSSTNHGQHWEPRGHAEKGHRFHPYASSRKDKAQSIGTPEMQQLHGGYPPQPAETPAARVDGTSIFDTIPTSLGDTPPPNALPDFLPKNLSEGFFVYKNNDPRQGLNVKATRRVLDWFLED